MAQQIKKKFIDGVVFTEIDGKIATALSTAEGYADGKLVEAKSYADTQDAAKLVEAKGYADGLLVEAKGYADTKKSEAIDYVDQVKNDLLGGAGAAYDTLKELEVALQNEDSAVVALTQVVGENLQTAKDYADAAVLVEKTRAEGVEALKADITYVDAQIVDAKAYADSIVAPVSSDLEVAKSDIVTIQGQLANLGAKQWKTEKFTLTSGDLSTRLLNEMPVVGSVFMFVDGIPMCEGVDFSINGAIVTWMGDLVSGPMALEAGDIVLVKYMA